MAEKICPLLQKACIEHQCKFYVHVVGKNPQTGGEIDHFDCAVSWLPLLIIENANEMRKATAGIHDFRNKVLEQQSMMIGYDRNHKQKPKLEDLGEPT